MRLIDADKLSARLNRNATPYFTVPDIENAPTIDVASIAVQLGYEQVVRCKDCEYSYDEISYLCCSHGVCVDCEVPPNFYCAEGKRKEPDE